MRVEPLEMRTMMAGGSNAFDLPVSSKHAAPPAVVEYGQRVSSQTTTGNSSQDSDSVSPRSLGLYDSTWGGEGFGRNVYWTGICAWSPAPNVVDMNRASVERVAKISKNGGNAVWTNQKIAPGTMTVLDYETPGLEDSTPTFAADRVRWFKAVAPEVTVGVYGYVMTNGLNLDNFARFNETDRAIFTRDVMARREVIDESDFIVFPAYLLGRASVDRDLAAFRNMANGFRELFPDKPIIPFVWGSYHTSWNPENDVLSDAVTAKYAQMLRESFDAVMVWGPRIDNNKLIDALYGPGGTEMPNGRPTNWANDLASTSDNSASQSKAKASGRSFTQSGPRNGRVLDLLRDDVLMKE